MTNIIYQNEHKIHPSYVYILINDCTKEHYIGARFANKVKPTDDLGIIYFTSSKVVKPRFFEFTYHILFESFDNNEIYFVEQYAIYLSHDSNKNILLNGHFHDISNKNILKWIKNPSPAYSEECRIKYSGIGNPMYGKCHSEESKHKISAANTGKIPWNKGKVGVYSEETKKTMGASNVGRVVSDETKTKYKLRSNGENNPMFGKKHTDETKQKISVSNSGERNGNYGRTGDKHPMFGKCGDLNPFYGKHHDDETRDKMSSALKNQKRLICIYCGKSGIAANMKRWHFDNCKLKEKGNNI